MANISGVDAPVLNDTDYVDKIKNSLNAIDGHDHSSTKGLQIPTGGIVDGAITNAKVSATADIDAVKVKAISNAKVIQSNATTGRLEASAVTSTELALLSGVTSLTDPSFGVVTLTEQAATQSTPASGKSKLYSKIDNALYFLDDNGVESLVGGGATGSASADELLQTQNEIAGYGLTTRQLDNSLRSSGLEVPAHTYFTGYLIDNYTSGASTATIVWNPVVLNDSDKNYDATTNWTAVGAGATLATNATAPKVGSNKLTFDKNGTATTAGIRYDRGSQNLAVGANYRLWAWINLPSTTNLTNVYIRGYADTTSNYREWTKTTNYAGTALSTGWNLILVDLSDTTGSTTGGTGWTYTTLARYFEIGVTASSAAQTYTAIAFDGMFFSQGDITTWGPKGLQFTGYDTSNKNDFTIDAASPFADGVVTLASTVAQNYTAGISNANACFIKRSTTSWSQAGLIGFDTSLTSGTIATEEEVRLTRILRESLSGNYKFYADMYTPQIYKVTTVGGSTIGVADSEVHTANLKNGDQIHIFTTRYSAGDPYFTLLATRSMTADSTASSGTTTLTVNTTGINVGDYVVKQHLTASSSVVAVSASESFSTLNYDTTPNGAQLIGSRSYPAPNNIYAHWTLGGPSNTLAQKDQTGNSRDLTAIGNPNRQDTFKSGKYALSGLTSSNYLRTSASTIGPIDGVSETVWISLWFYFDASNASERTMLAARRYDGAAFFGWHFTVVGSTSTCGLAFFNNTGSPTGNLTSGTLTNGTWNHAFMKINTGAGQLWINGSSVGTTSGSIGSPPSTFPLYIGAVSNDTGGTIDATMASGATNIKIADVMIWRDGTLTQADVNYLYNGGIPQFFGYQPAVVRNEYKVTGVSGQRLSAKFKLNRTTTGVAPSFLNVGGIKIG